MNLLEKFPQKYTQFIALGFLTVLLVVGAIPGYLSGKWSWADMPQIQNKAQLQTIRKDGLNLSEWKTLEKKPLKLRGSEWWVQTVEHNNQTAILLMLVQKYYKDRPQVEWMDINGLQQWKTDFNQSVQLNTTSASTPSKSVEVNTHFFRSLTPSVNTLATLLWQDCPSDQLCKLYGQQRRRQTYAVMQWYAWPEGGSPSPSRWFVADRIAQLSNLRAPWVAVNLLIPIEPLGNIDEVQATAQSLGEEVQAALMAEALTFN